MFFFQRLRTSLTDDNVLFNEINSKIKSHSLTLCSLKESLAESTFLQLFIEKCQKEEKFVGEIKFSYLNNQLKDDIFGAFVTTGDGNCLFNAVSQCLFGNELFSNNLRLAAALQVMQNSDLFQRILTRESFFMQ